MFKRTAIFISLLLLVLAGLGFIKYQQIQQGMAMMAAGAPPPTTIEVIDTKHVQWQPRISAVGTLTAREGIDVSNEVEGIIEKIYFTSGQKVKVGVKIVALNDDVEQADLVSFKAQEDLARSLFKRTEGMWKKKTISETEFDNARSNLKVAQANVIQTKARIAKKSIRAPFTGVLGIKQISIGQYLPPGTMLVNLQDYSSLYIDFAVAEKYFPDVKKGLEVQFHVSAYGDQLFTGKVIAVDARVNEATRNISVRAYLKNEEGLLRPGMYAGIDLMLDESAEVIVVPATAIAYSSFGNALFIIKKNDEGALIAQRVQITTGEQRGDQVVILTGLKGDEQVVQAGVSKLRNNAPVTISEQVRLKGSE
ncbi:MAG: efflux transporter periplasmic adaptor subunit [Thiotrichaceae bacterium]|nr:MAG: efflux transporter periplasmic adaptor subunit [Thiotrichaceae bacterium]